MGKRALNRGNQNLGAKNLKLAAFMSKLIEHCSKSYNIKCVDGTSVLQYQHQLKLEQKKDDLKMLKIDKNNWGKTVENIMLHLKLMRMIRGNPLADVVQHHIKVAHILSNIYYRAQGFTMYKSACAFSTNIAFLEDQTSSKFTGKISAY